MQTIEMSTKLPSTRCICGQPGFRTHEELLSHLIEKDATPDGSDHAQEGWREEREQRTANG